MVKKVMRPPCGSTSEGRPVHIRPSLPWRDFYFLASSESPFTRLACCKVASSLMEGILWSLVGSLRSAGLRLHHRTFRDALARKPGPKSCSENRPDYRKCQVPHLPTALNGL